jgi:hypothetical protein
MFERVLVGHSIEVDWVVRECRAAADVKRRGGGIG